MSCGVVNPYMNKRAGPGEAYEPTFHEHVANTFSHGVAIVPSVLITRSLVASAYRDLQYQLMLLLGFFTTLLFSASTLYHFCELMFRPHKRKLRYYLHIMDRAVIYFFIAASSTPWLSLRHSDLVGTNLKWIVWVGACCGTAYQLKFHERYKSMETCLYIVIASVPYVAIFTMNDRTGLPLMLLGGVVYLVGVVFFKMDGIIPFAHAIWHCHVVVGASIHTYAVYATLLGPDKLNPFPAVDFPEQQ
ncbi:Protein Y71G12B.23 a [Aphelenchoides avenae]|nr:Protein Y71G12B.23 a [Aphelenchus avenae]